jgi:GNAT superfamily N-acetyltransferase
MNPDLTLLDNPAWWALYGPQHDLASGNGHLKAYLNHILPFAAWNAPITAALASGIKALGSDAPPDISPLELWLPAGKPFFIIGDLPVLPPNWQIEKELPCLQMLWTQGEQGPVPLVPQVTPLKPKDKMTMYDLVQKVHPGYYEPGSYQLGKYFGIWEGDRLVAMAGERLRLDGMSEISAVCTDPDFRNKGYGARLTLEVCSYNSKEGRLPFLHVLETNQRAIRLYESLGFKTRRTISFWKLSYH